jgi:hypothetical protein
MKDEKDMKSNKGSTANKVKKLQKQYNKILVDLFDQFAAESIEEALEQNEGAFGENIESIVQCALDCLKSKVLGDLGVNASSGGVSIAVGGFDLDDIVGDEEVEDEGPEVRAFETEKPAKSNEDEEDEDEDEDEDDSVKESYGSNRSILDDVIQQVFDAPDVDTGKKIMIDRIDNSKIPPMQKARMKQNLLRINTLEELWRYATNSMFMKKGMGVGPRDDDALSHVESMKTDKILSASRRGDQSLLSEAYAQMYKK